MSEKDDKVFHDLVDYVKGKKRKVGYCYPNEGGSICIKADSLMDASTIGRMLKKDGLYVMERGSKSD